MRQRKPETKTRNKQARRAKPVRWLKLPWVETTQGRCSARTKHVLASINAIFEGERWFMLCSIAITGGEETKFTLGGCLLDKAAFVIEAYLSTYSHGIKWLQNDVRESTKYLAATEATR